ARASSATWPWPGPASKLSTTNGTILNPINQEGQGIAKITLLGQPPTGRPSRFEEPRTKAAAWPLAPIFENPIHWAVIGELHLRGTGWRRNGADRTRSLRNSLPIRLTSGLRPRRRPNSQSGQSAHTAWPDRR